MTTINQKRAKDLIKKALTAWVPDFTYNLSVVNEDGDGVDHIEVKGGVATATDYKTKKEHALDAREVKNLKLYAKDLQELVDKIK